MKLIFNKFFTSKGRSSRKEYSCKFILAIFIFIFSNYTIDAYTEANLFSVIYIWTFVVILLFTIIQYFPLAIRRLHDLNTSGWYVLLTFAPFGQFLILWLMFKKGTPGPNKYGPPPEY